MNKHHYQYISKDSSQPIKQIHLLLDIAQLTASIARCQHTRDGWMLEKLPGLFIVCLHHSSLQPIPLQNTTQKAHNPVINSNNIVSKLQLHMHSNINVHHHKNLNSITVQTPATSFVSTNENYCLN